MPLIKRALLCATICAASGVAADEPLHVLRTMTWSDGTRIEYRATLDQLRNAKRWSAESLQPPPLSVESAVGIARKHVKAASPADLIVTGIELQYSLSTAGVWWHYVVRLYDREEAYGPRPPETREVVILLDGTVIEGVSTEATESRKPAARRLTRPCDGTQLFSRFEGKRYAFCVSKVSLKSAPKWTIAAKTHPPLTAPSASRIARAALSKFGLKPEEWLVHQVSIQEGTRDAWFYVVTFMPLPSNVAEGVMFDSFYVPVLMDGTSPAPTIDDSPDY